MTFRSSYNRICQLCSKRWTKQDAPLQWIEIEQCAPCAKTPKLSRYRMEQQGKGKSTREPRRA